MSESAKVAFATGPSTDAARQADADLERPMAHLPGQRGQWTTNRPGPTRVVSENRGKNRGAPDLARGNDLAAQRFPVEAMGCPASAIAASAPARQEQTISTLAIVPPQGVRLIPNLEVWSPRGYALLLDLYLPPRDAPVLFWIHGGGWDEGDCHDRTAVPLTAHG